MYPFELENFIKSRNNYLGGNDLYKAISIEENPQLNHIKFDPYNNQYQMWDEEGHYYEFTPMPFKEAKQKGLVKRLSKKR